jgi:hypothetical protein
MRFCFIVIFCVFISGCASSDRIASFGSSGESIWGGIAQSHSDDVSEQFGAQEAKQLLNHLNAEPFSSALARYNCGDPVPKFGFQVILRRKTPDGARRVEVSYSPPISPAGRTRCLFFGMGYLIDKAIAKIDPIKTFTLTHVKPWGEEFTVEVDRIVRGPHCDCSKRDSGEEWVTFPGPDEHPENTMKKE